MNKDSLKKLMDLIDDQEFKDTMKRIDDNLDRVERARDKRLNPVGDKIRLKDIRASLDDSLHDKLEQAAKGIGLVLTGGGAKGSYQVGALKALSERKLIERLLGPDQGITGVAGTSAGAFNAALYAGCGMKKTQEMWESVLPGGMAGKDGFFSLSDDNDRYLEDLIRKSGVVPRITMDSILTIATAFDTDSGYPKDFILNNMTEEDKIRALLASAAVPLALKEQTIGRVTYIDGGIPVFGSNMPIAPLYHLGYRRFIVIHCSSRREAAARADVSRINTVFNKEEYFNGAVFVHLYSRRDLGDLLTGTVNFDHDVIMRNIYLGYMDMLANRDDLCALFKEPEALDEIHMVDGEQYRSYIRMLENL